MLKEWVKKIKKRRKLRKMERALGIRLKKWQTKVVMMDADPIFELKKWDRKTGKTMCACLWTMLNAKEDLRVRSMRLAVKNPRNQDGWMPEWPTMLPDPDAYRTRSALESAINQYMRMRMSLEGAGIKVPDMKEW